MKYLVFFSILLIISIIWNSITIKYQFDTLSYILTFLGIGGILGYISAKMGYEF